MVEAVGIEPTSESLQQQNLHACPVSKICSVEDWNWQTNLPNVPHQVLNSSPREGKRTKKPAKVTPRQPRGLDSLGGHAFTQLALTVGWHLLFLATFLRGGGTSTCIYRINYFRRSQSPPFRIPIKNTETSSWLQHFGRRHGALYSHALIAQRKLPLRIQPVKVVANHG